MPAATLPGGVKAHLAVPPVGDGPWPGVVVLHESFGLTDDIRQQADRFAAAGYLALAPDLYSAGGAWRCIRATFRSLMAGHGKAFDDIETARTWLAARDDCTGRIGVIGFCMGGGFALLAANDGFDAASVNYGRLPRDLEPALRGACPLVANYGAKDRTLRGAAARLESALDAVGVEHDVKEFPTAGHSFLNDQEEGPRALRPLARVMGIGPDPAAAPEAWRRIEDHFAKHLKT
jgi:carboxymethylenebutenolidase